MSCSNFSSFPLPSTSSSSSPSPATTSPPVLLAVAVLHAMIHCKLNVNGAGLSGSLLGHVLAVVLGAVSCEGEIQVELTHHSPNNTKEMMDPEDR